MAHPRISPAIRSTTKEALKDYLEQLDGKSAENIWRMVLDEFEPAVLELMMIRNHGNKTATAKELGINRLTLQTRLKRHDLA